MSLRTPVAIINLPNQPFLLGTFDTTNFQNWWKSKPFPDEIQFIKKGFHVFGRTHLAIAKRADGRWAIYRSLNYGIDWERVFLAAEGEVIYEAIIIKFGWVIVNTSTGFYESVKAGKDGSWTKISSLPGASATPAFCNAGVGDVLLCTDGRYIWRSTDKARHWTLVCDQASVGTRGWYKVNTELWDLEGFAWTYGSPLTPAIAGANGEVVCAYGPWITTSEDGGLHWNVGWIDIWWFHWKNCWDGFYKGFEKLSETGGPVFPPRDIIYDRFPKSATSPPKFVIKQILVSSVSGPSIEDVSYVIRVDDLIPAPGETKLFSRVFYVHHGQYYHPVHDTTWVDDPGPTFHPKFQQFLSPDENLNQLSAYETAILGEPGMNRIVVSAQTTVDSNGNPTPSLKYSINGGKDWVTITVSNLKVADENGLPMASGAFLDDTYAKSIWVSPACDNYGWWNYIEEERTQCQSYEMDVEIEGKKTLETEQKVDAIVVKIGEKDDSVDAIVAKDQPKPYDVDALAEGVGSKTYRIDRGIEGEVERTESVDAIVAKDKDVEDSLDALIQKNQRLLYRVAVGLHDQNSKSYLVGVKIVKSGLIKRLSRIERLSPQMLDLYLPYVPYNPYDSAWEYV